MNRRAFVTSLVASGDCRGVQASRGYASMTNAVPDPRARLLRLLVGTLFGVFVAGAYPPAFGQASVPAALDAMLAAKQRLERAEATRDKATAWRALQKAADDLVQALPQNLSNEQCYDEREPQGLRETCPGYRAVRQAQVLGRRLPGRPAWLTT